MVLSDFTHARPHVSWELSTFRNSRACMSAIDYTEGLRRGVGCFVIGYITIIISFSLDERIEDFSLDERIEDLFVSEIPFLAVFYHSGFYYLAGSEACGDDVYLPILSISVFV